MRDVIVIGRRVTMREITEVHAAAHGVDIKVLLGPDRTRWISAIRNAAILVMHTHGKSASEIGRFFNRDHSSILYAIKRAKGAPASSLRQNQPRPLAQQEAA